MNIVLAYRGRYLVRQALDLETLSSVLRAENHDVRLVYDPAIFSVSDNVFQLRGLAQRLTSAKRFAAKVMALSPDAIIVSVLPGSFAFFCEVIELVKKRKNIPVVCLGLFPTLAPKTVMEKSLCDYAICGEAEKPLVELLENLFRAGMPGPVPGVWQRINGKIVHREPQGLADLNVLPFPDKDLFFPYVSQRKSYAAMVSRGCPFSCSYCEETCVKAVHGPKYFRRKSVSAVIEELSYARRKYGFSEVIFKDSYLSGDTIWLSEFSSRYKKEIAVPFKCFCTVKGFSFETAGLLKDAGCYCVEFGLQTLNERIRKDLLCRNETNKDALAAFSACAEHKLWYDVDHMFGLPGETEEDHRQAALFYQGQKYLNRVKVHNLVYYPNAPILAAAIKMGALSEDEAAAIQEGAEDDFYGNTFSSGQDRAMATAYGSLLKILPLVPAPALPKLFIKNRVRILARIPAPVMAALQAALAIRGRDRRFMLYFFSYPRLIFVAARDLF